LFNGFYEGNPDLVVDRYGSTLVIFDYRNPPQPQDAFLNAVTAKCRETIPGIQCVVLKSRYSDIPGEQQGKIILGEPDRWVMEHGVRYAVNLTMNQDASLYLDTRQVRSWLKQNMVGKRVLNTFAYTGSLGVAAAAGGARQVIQTDLNRDFLSLAKTSYSLNGLTIRKADFQAGDFFSVMKRLNRQGDLFDCVILDPPFFSSTQKGRVDLQREYHRLVNKVRPLINDNGWLVAINNALFLSGAEYLAMLQALCADGYLSIEELVAVPPDVTGFLDTIRNRPPIDPAPFNHPTKIAILKVRRKSQ
jgi:23S rRNA (cytosine1962-C5)-methyltransferase